MLAVYCTVFQGNVGNVDSNVSGDAVTAEEPSAGTDEPGLMEEVVVVDNLDLPSLNEGQEVIVMASGAVVPPVPCGASASPAPPGGWRAHLSGSIYFIRLTQSC